MSTKPKLRYLKECEQDKIELAIFNELSNHDIKIRKFEGSMFYIQVGCLEVELRYEICSCHGGRIWLYQPGTNINIELSSTTYDESKGIVDPYSEIAYRIEYELIEAINSFSHTVCEDDDYIDNNLDPNSLIVDNKVVQLPCSVFKLHSAIYSRLVFKALTLINVKKDIERKHIEIIKDLALNLENGKKIKLPLDVTVTKEYGFLTFENVYVEKPVLRKPNKCFSFEVEGFGTVTINRVKTGNLTDGLYFDYRKVPKDAYWRFREDGDVFEKFGGGTKKLKSIFIDKKIPIRKRDYIPVLASGNEVYVIAGVAISDKVKVEDVPTCYRVTVE